MKRVAILAYHKVGPPPPTGWETWFYVPEAIFAVQLALVRRLGWQPIDAATFTRGLDDPASLPPRAALLTFDDAYASLRSATLPLLVDAGWPAVVFVPTDYVGGRNAFDDGTEPEEAICGWDDLRALAAAGVAVASHGCAHRAFGKLTAAEVAAEARRSKALLQERVGATVDLLAYPYGDPGDPATTGAALAAAGYRAGLRYTGGVASLPAADRFDLPRIAVGPDTDLAAALGGA